jgi:4-diphosphocytidyl-2-C-methyl-D-erythritol kinase
VILFPNAKINLGLHVMAKRDDGYHEIETVMLPVGWRDALEMIPAPEFSFQISGGGWDSSSDLGAKAFRLIDSLYDIPPVSMFLLKNIPAGAGLGGGSADAAAALRLLDKIGQLELGNARLHELAQSLGKDCPFFLQGSAMLATGTGTKLKRVDIRLEGMYLAVAVPEVRVDTTWAYGRVTPREPESRLRDIIVQPLSTWKANLKNDFEDIVFARYPQVGDLKQRMYAAGALYASMSGSGSAVFGLFEEEPMIGRSRAEETVFKERFT